MFDWRGDASGPPGLIADGHSHQSTGVEGVDHRALAMVGGGIRARFRYEWEVELIFDSTAIRT
jgi:hypothetical protein